MIKIENITKSFKNREIFKNASITFPRTGLFCIVGCSGSGKTTLLNMIAGLDTHYKGTLSIDGLHINRLSDKKLLDYRLRNIGFVFQDCALLNLETAFNNVLLPLDATSLSMAKSKRARVYDLLELVDLKGKEKCIVNKMSGGEKQKVAIARALASGTKIILADEPTGSLDKNNGEVVMNLLKKISKNLLVIVSTHDRVLASEYADAIVSIKNQQILNESNKERNVENTHIKASGSGKRKRSNSLSLLFHITHAWHRFKATKWRNLFTNTMLSISLSGFAISLLLSNAVTANVKQSFETITNGQQIAMTLKQVGGGIEAIYSAPFDKVKSIIDVSKDYLDGVGVTYLVNFEDFFKDQNVFNLYSSMRKYYLSSYSMRSVNDFVTLDSSSSLSFYPNRPTLLSDDELVLGLTYVDMTNLCYALQIQRNYYSLGQYLSENNVEISLIVANTDWQYEDEQIFTLKAVVETDKPLIFHTNELWNQVVFETMMRLPSIDSENKVAPWEMYKIYYLKTKEDPSLFLSYINYNELAHDFVFERTNSSYHPLLCKIGENCAEKRVLVFYVDKNTIDLNDIDIVRSITNCFDAYYLTSQYGYSSYASNLISGFSKNVFVSLSDQKIDLAIDADTTIKNEDNIALDLPPGVIQGNVLNSLSNGLKFSARLDNIMVGRKPNNNKEIVISSKLAESLGSKEDIVGSSLNIAAITSENIEDSNIKKTYKKTKVTIVGVKDSPKHILYHNNDWSISFFRDELGISSFLLNPTGVVFEIPDNARVDGLCESLNKMFRDYTFSNPIEQVASSLKSTMSYVETILLVLSFIAMAISLIMLSSVIMTNILESKKDIEMLYHIGIRQSEISLTFVIQALMQSLFAFFVAALETIVVQIAISKFSLFAIETSGWVALNLTPIFIIFAIAVLSSIIIGFVVVIISFGKLMKTKKKNQLAIS